MVRIVGIVNVTRDSFSDGGRFLDPGAALAHARRMRADGADVVEVGAESTHPDSEDVPAAEELRRLEPVVRPLVAEGAVLSVDTVKAAVMRAAASWGVAFLNDVGGMRDPDCVAAAAACDARVIVVFARGAAGRAQRIEAGSEGLLDEIAGFFADRVAALERAGVARRRLVLDPGMGFFLGAGPEPSLVVLRGLRELRRMGLPLMVSVSRKSFLGTLTGREVAGRGAATLAAELWAAMQGVDYLRTHEVGMLRDGLCVLQSLGAIP
jgi:dihydropteroate synthase type 2